MPVDDATFAALLADVSAETAELLTLLDGLHEGSWSAPTPAVGWNIHDQVVHLASFDELAGLGFSDPEAFLPAAAALLATGDDWVDRINVAKAPLPPAETLDWFRAARRGLIDALTAAGPAARTPWFGPSMSSASSATARLMETWAHGQDIFDALGVARGPTDRLRHVCHLGVITLGHSFAMRGQEIPTDQIHVALVAPSGATWAWGSPNVRQRVSGTAEDFALVVTQRRHRADTALHATPGTASDWLDIAQAFAGNVGAGRRPGSHTRTSMRERFDP